MIAFNYIKFTNFKISYKRVRKSHRDPYINIINFRVTQHTNVLSAVLLRTLCKAPVAFTRSTFGLQNLPPSIIVIFLNAHAHSFIAPLLIMAHSESER